MAGPWTIDSETLDSRAILIDFGDPDPDQQKAHELDGDLLEKNGVMRIEPIPAGGLSRLGSCDMHDLQFLFLPWAILIPSASPSYPPRLPPRLSFLSIVGFTISCTPVRRLLPLYDLDRNIQCITMNEGQYR